MAISVVGLCVAAGCLVNIHRGLQSGVIKISASLSSFRSADVGLFWFESTVALLLLFVSIEVARGHIKAGEK